MKKNVKKALVFVKEDLDAMGVDYDVDSNQSMGGEYTATVTHRATRRTVRHNFSRGGGGKPSHKLAKDNVKQVVKRFKQEHDGLDITSQE